MNELRCFLCYLKYLESTKMTSQNPSLENKDKDKDINKNKNKNMI
jgi:hypothetical protein